VVLPESEAWRMLGGGGSIARACIPLLGVAGCARCGGLVAQSASPDGGYESGSMSSSGSGGGSESGKGTYRHRDGTPY
jgi:hypothetical protein